MLEEMNPWWFTDNWEREDPQIRDWKSMEIRWFPKWIDKISLEPFSLNFVYGPRQVGKTTGIKLLIRKIIERDIDPKNIVYINCELLIDQKHLLNILREFSDKKYIFLDEVTSLEYWWKPLKGLIDLGKLRNSVVTVTGSSTIKLRKFTEAFPGRRGKGKKLEILPLSFPEFLEVFGRGRSYGEKLRKYFRKYLELGGFPRSINRDPSFMEDFVSSLDREIEAIGRDHKIARQVIYSVLLKAPSAVSYSSLAKEVGLNHVTVRKYLEILEDMFILKIAFLKEGRRIVMKREKKIFLRDPSIARLYSKMFDIKIGDEVLLEWVVQEHLYRKFGEIYYYRNSYEIDCIAGNLKVEVKKRRYRRKYPKSVILLGEDEVPRFLVRLFLNDLR